VKKAQARTVIPSGQVCTNATRVYVHSSIVDKFAEALVKEANEKLKVELLRKKRKSSSDRRPTEG